VANAYLMVTDKGVTIVSRPWLNARGDKVGRDSIVLSDPTGTIPVDDDGRIAAWIINMMATGTAIIANDRTGRVDLTHLGTVVSVTGMDVDAAADVMMVDFNATVLADADRIVMSPHAIWMSPGRRNPPRPYPRRVALVHRTGA
jgi:hypothetical protein